MSVLSGMVLYELLCRFYLHEGAVVGLTDGAGDVGPITGEAVGEPKTN